MRIRFLALVGLGALASLPITWVTWLRPRVRAWGARPNDTCRPLPGDEIVPDPEIVHTRAISIGAPREAVWPWLLQLGQGRGGLYSYDWLENALGCDIHSVDRIVPELQDLRVGDVVSLRKGDMPAFVLQAIDPGRSIVLVARDPATGGPAHADPAVPMSVDESWAIVLEPDGDGRSRLLARSRRRTRDAALDRLFWAAVETASLPMERRMLIGIRDRAEALAAASGGPAEA
jgi:hypothetical protein